MNSNSAKKGSSQFPMYRNHPLVRCGDVIYYGSMKDKFVVRMEIKSKKKGIEPVKQQNGKIMMVVIPILLGIFALFYNSVFAIYMLVGQLVSLILSPLQLMIIDKIIDNKSKKEENKVIVDYSRKF